MIRTLWVVPHAGTWIEIEYEKGLKEFIYVVPHAGTWIEMFSNDNGTYEYTVVPHAGTWIEIAVSTGTDTTESGRSPRGNVD